ncbi:MAG: hypothetical protein NWR03_15665, partial [Akkermansiaceae bacterium]|nr:hypothetical protein [Akkermansiaceae bacterium]
LPSSSHLPSSLPVDKCPPTSESPKPTYQHNPARVIPIPIPKSVSCLPAFLISTSIILEKAKPKPPHALQSYPCKSLIRT